jgi:hypothetical protein
MCDCLSVGSDHIVLLVRQVDVTRLEAPENILDQLHVLLRSSVVDDDLPLDPSKSRQ